MIFHQQMLATYRDSARNGREKGDYSMEPLLGKAPSTPADPVRRYRVTKMKFAKKKTPETGKSVHD